MRPADAMIGALAGIVNKIQPPGDRSQKEVWADIPVCLPVFLTKTSRQECLPHIGHNRRFLRRLWGIAVWKREGYVDMDAEAAQDGRQGEWQKNRRSLRLF